MGSPFVKRLNTVALDLEETDENMLLQSILFTPEFQGLVTKRLVEDKALIGKLEHAIADPEERDFLRIANVIKMVMRPDKVRTNLANFIEEAGLHISEEHIISALNW